MVITNPIVLGDACDDKEFRLDVRIVLNEKTIMNLEMQVSNLYDWPERSVSYLSRIYDSLFRGEEYANVKSAMHIGILDFTLFPEYPEFYASNMIMNEKTYRIYSDKFALNVLDLSKVELATDEDKEWKLDYWARLFKATTWEEIKMIASNDDYLKEASNTLYLLNEDFNIRERCRNRIEYYRVLDRYESMIERKDAEIQQLRAERDLEIEHKDLEIKQLHAEIERLKARRHD